MAPPDATHADAMLTEPSSAAPPHEIFVNGHVLTMDASGTIAEAVSVRDGRIEAIGRSEALLEAADDQTLVVDLRGRTLMPGFVDAHGHFPGSGQTVFSADLNSPPIGGITSMPQLLQRLEGFAQVRPDGWIIGHGYDDTLIAEKRHPTRDDLDQVSMERPVAVIHVSGHLAVANSAALVVLGIDESTPDPEGGVIVRDPQSVDGRSQRDADDACSTSQSGRSVPNGCSITGIFCMAGCSGGSQISTAHVGQVCGTLPEYGCGRRLR